MMHHEFQTARQAEILARAAHRRLAREAEEAAKAAKGAREAKEAKEVKEAKEARTTTTDSRPGPDSRTRYARTA
ncbi:hypothetical protein [Streptomyces alboflavus]|uniref:hypothetical protein n=1 Tax=Streptomyces alboflavus TaxID=67267 RepID=UPI0012FE9548|nr:hypothetical protein [Streptomyces alboflavus]